MSVDNSLGGRSREFHISGTCLNLYRTPFLMLSQVDTSKDMSSPSADPYTATRTLLTDCQGHAEGSERELNQVLRRLGLGLDGEVLKWSSLLSLNIQEYSKSIGSPRMN